jgi:hypothetical protein
LEGKQNDGTMWIDTVSNILDWMLANENVVITAQSGNLFTVKNNNSSVISGITLKNLNNNIQYAKIDDTYQIYVDGTNVVLPKFTASEQKVVQIVSGNYNSSLPKLTSVPVHTNVDNATYNANTGIVSLIFDYTEPCDTSYVACDASTETIAPVVQNYKHPFFNSTINSINTITSLDNTTLSATLTAAPTTFNAVDMEITPSAGSVDVTINTWNTSGNYYKKWIETGSVSSITTNHTVGDLNANTSYDVIVDGQMLSRLTANSGGQISFNYSGGYSTKTFEVRKSPDPAALTSGGSSNTSVGTPPCNNAVTTGVPDLFEIRTSKNTATLYFAPPIMPYSNFYIAFSRRTDTWEYGTQYNQGYSGGVLSYTINSLQPNTKYYFKLRAGNGCGTGSYGNIMTATTTSSGQTKTYYRNVATAVVQQTKAVVNTFLSPIKKFINNLIPTPKPTATTAPSIINVQTDIPTQVPTQTQSTPKSKFCILWWCF